MKTELVRPLRTIRGVTRCSSLESLFYRLVTPSVVFCFRERLDPIRLKHALVRVLSDYGVYAGRLSRRQGAVYIEHGRGGARFELADSPLSSQALGAAATEAKDLSVVCPRISLLRVLQGKPLFAARITQTRDGTVIGVTWHHIVGDVYSTMLLMRAWALAYREQPYEKPLDVADRDAFLAEHLPRPALIEPRLRMISWWEYGQLLGYLLTHRGRRVDWHFSRAELAAIHAQASRGRSVTRHDALCAHVFTRIRQLQGLRGGSRLSVSINCRKPFGLPPNLLGNTLDMVTTTVNASDGTATIASALRARIRAFASSATLQHEAMALQAERRGWLQLMRYIDTNLDPRRGNLFISNTVSSGIYDLVFASTKPVLVHGRPMQATPAAWFGIISESPGSGGLTVRLWLPAEFARALEREATRARLAGTAARARIAPAGEPAAPASCT